MAHFSSQKQPFVDGLVTLNVTVLVPILLHMPDVHLKYQFKKIRKKIHHIVPAERDLEVGKMEES